jgi:hypothetical protein
VTRRVLLWAAAALTAVFAAGHSLGVYGAPHGLQVPVAAAMKTVRFDLFGSERSYWDLFHGYGVLIICSAVFLVLLYAQLSRMEARAARPIVLLAGALQICFAIIGFSSFFWAPGATNAAAAACALVSASLPAG